MSKMGELSHAAGELKRCGEILIGVSDTLAALFGGDGNQRPAAVSEEENAPVKPMYVTLEQVRALLAEKSRDGYTAEVRALLEKHGAARLSDIDPSEYPALLTEAEVLGNG